MRSRLAAVLGLFCLLGQPAQAQTDDRILNDLVRLYAGIHVIQRMDLRCSGATDYDSEVSESFAALLEEGELWKIAGLSLMTARGVVPQVVLNSALADVGTQYEAAFEADPDPAGTCMQFAADIRAGRVSLDTLYPAETRRLNAALGGDYPVLDISASQEVADAMAVRAIFDGTGARLRLCALLWPEDEATFVDSGTYWRARNQQVWDRALEVLTIWGALDEARLERAQAEALAAYTGSWDDNEAHCYGFLANVEDGGEDIETREPALFNRVWAATGPDPQE